MKFKSTFASAAAVVALYAVPTGVAFAQKTNLPTASASTSGLPRIVWGGKTPLPMGGPAQTPFRDPADGNVCISPESLAPLGITFLADEQSGTVSLVSPSGAMATVPLRIPPVGSQSRGVFVGAVEAIEALGGKCEWEAATNTLHARAILTSVEVLGGQLRVKSTLPVIANVMLDNGGRRVLIAFPGAEVGNLPRTLSLNAPNIAQARIGQFTDDVARIVLELKTPGGFRNLSDHPVPSTQMVLNPLATEQAVQLARKTDAGEKSAPVVSVKPAPAPKPAPSKKPAVVVSTKKPVKKAPAPPPVAVLSGVTFRKGSDTLAQFVVSADRAPAFRAAQRKGLLTLDLLNTSLGAASLGSIDGVASLPFVKSARMVARGQNVATLVLGLTRAVCFTIRPAGPAGSLLLELTLPRSAGGQLAGKTVIVDAGHGGNDSGARGVNGTREKDVALAIASNLSESLRDSGANVIMTRTDDTFIDLGERSNIANRMNADFFIAVHADSGDSNHAANGSTIYYHLDNAACRTLAQCIAERMGDMGGIRSKGAHSDGTIYSSGFSVLRRSQMVSVLCETGYMSNASDVRLLNDANVQKKIAQNIAQGLRDYIEGNPDFDTRNVNPNAGGVGLSPLPDSDENGSSEILDAPPVSAPTLPQIPAAPPENP